MTASGYRLTTPRAFPHEAVADDCHEPVRRIIGARDHSALTVTVADREGVVRALMV